MARAPGRPGLFASLRNGAITLLAMAQTRLELLGNEFETQKLAVLRMLVLALAIVYCAGMGVIVLVTLITVAFWEYRLGVLAGFAVVFLGAAFVLYRNLMRTIDASEAPFSATLDELREDMRRLQAATNHDAPRD